MCAQQGAVNILSLLVCGADKDHQNVFTFNVVCWCFSSRAMSVNVTSLLEGVYDTSMSSSTRVVELLSHVLVGDGMGRCLGGAK